MKFVLMRPMKYILVAILAVCGFNPVFAQMSDGVKFDKLSHDFGKIKEEIGTAIAIFEFTNAGKTAIYIKNIETSCGCTKPEYSKDTILPGGKGFIKALYETRGRSGDFHKNLFVYFNEQDMYQSLSITGTVIPEANLAKRPVTYNTTYSNLALTSMIAAFPDLHSNQTQTYTIKAFNYQGYPIKIWEVNEVPDYLKINIGDSVIDVMDSMFITFTVDGSKIAELGEIRQRIAFVTDDVAGETKFLHVYINLKEDFSKLTKQQKINAPVLSIDSGQVLNFGTASAGSIVQKTVTISNNGKTDLKIRYVKPSCSCVIFNLPKQILAPGEKMAFVIIIDTVNQTIASHSKYLTIYSNDPKKSEQNIKLLINITN